MLQEKKQEWVWKPALLQRMYLADKFKKIEDKKEEVKILSCLMSEAWSTVSGLHSQRIEWEMLLSQLHYGHPDKMAS